VSKIHEFEWDLAKADANVAKHEIDFWEAIEVFDSPHLTVRSRYEAEVRFLSIGLMKSKIVAVVWTWRGEAKRIISARSARHEEREEYRHRFGR
jgi:uncharacterized DUF497 family protein